MKLSKLEYAGRYDDMANELYRFILLLLGDSTLAQRCMAEVFVQGFRLHEGERFEESMLRVAMKNAAEHKAQQGQDYIDGLQSTAASKKLVSLLSELGFKERAALLLPGFRLTDEAVAALTGQSRTHTGRMMIDGCKRLQQVCAG